MLLSRFRRVGLMLILIAAAAACHLSCRGTEECEVLPRGPLVSLSLHSREWPASYEPLRDPALLAEVQMESNPDYVRKPSDLEQVARAGGLTSFLALYGPASNDVRLVINGVYFRSAQHCQEFADRQHEKRREVMAYRKATTDGLWLLMAARNPEHTYEPEEAERLRASLDRYAARLGLEVVFDRLENGDEH